MARVLCRRPAMATLFEFLLVGDDEENLTAIAEAALDEVSRIEQMISMFDRTSELARINRVAFAKPVIASHELFDILQDCFVHHASTQGEFDPCHSCPESYGQAVQLLADTRQVRFHHPQTRIDLGGFGKGYALDCASGLLNGQATSYILHGGTSSVCVVGKWQVALRLPGSEQTLGTLELENESLSCSANDSHGSVVIAEKGTIAEAWSTAILHCDSGNLPWFCYDGVKSAAKIDTQIHWIKELHLWPRQLVEPSS